MQNCLYCGDTFDRAHMCTGELDLSNHHPYCVQTHADYMKQDPRAEWRCECSILYSYDEWRKRKASKKNE